jgi:hypothetical protein
VLAGEGLKQALVEFEYFLRDDATIAELKP